MRAVLSTRGANPEILFRSGANQGPGGASPAAPGSNASQAAVIAFFSDPSNLSCDGPVEVIRTHAAFVFLAGASAYKIKRAVRYDYLDFSTLTKRRNMLLRELELNAPAAPQIYRDVVALVRDDAGKLVLGGVGKPVEWVLVMNRFDTDMQLDKVAARGGLTDDLAVALGQAVAAYHDAAPRRSEYGGAALIGTILDELNHVFAGMADVLGQDPIDQFSDAATKTHRHLSRLLDDRGRAGHVRRFHGDLHLRNITLIDGRPVLFDALEFNETLGTGDVLYDVAFLVMDLLHQGPPRAANLALSAYLFAEASRDHDAGLAALPLFLSIRAAIRTMVIVQTHRIDPSAIASLPEARAYLELALSFLAPTPARLIVIGGLSGTGKSTISAALAPMLGKAPGAVHLRSDLERKALFGAAPTTHLPAAAYGTVVSKQVYSRMLDRARRILSAGHSVILDATFLDESDRAAVAVLADDVGVEMEALWLEAPIAALLERVDSRKNDASDADAKVVLSQAQAVTPPIFWARVDAAGDVSATTQAALTALSGVTPSATCAG